MGYQKDLSKAQFVKAQLDTCKGIASVLTSRLSDHSPAKLTTYTEAYATLHPNRPLASLTAHIATESTYREFRKNKIEYYACIFHNAPESTWVFTFI